MTFDVVSFGETMFRLSPPAGTRLYGASSFTSYVAGAESNVLACLARLGLSCAWMSALPSNPLGRHVSDELRRHGVDTNAVGWQDENSRLGLFYAEESPAPLGVQVYYDRRYSACAGIDPDQIDLDVINGAKMLHLTGITPALGGGARDLFCRLVRVASQRGVPISFDVNYRAKLWDANEAAAGIEGVCEAASLLFCTRADAAALWGYTGGPGTILDKMAARFGRNREDQTIILTLGSDGAIERRNDKFDEAPAFPSEGFSRFGSGDAFVAGYLAAHLDTPVGTRLEQEIGRNPLLVGNAVAALKRCIDGDIAIIVLDDILRLITQREGAHFR